MARSSLAHALKFNFIFSHSSIDWTAACQLAPINFLFIVGFNQFQFVTELVEEIFGEHNLRITDDGGNYLRN